MSSRVTHVLCDRVRHITIADYSEFTYVACTLPALCCSAQVCAAVCASDEDGERLLYVSVAHRCLREGCLHCVVLHSSVGCVCDRLT